MLPIFLKQLFWAIPSLFWRKTDRNAPRFEQKCDHSVYAATSVSKTGEMLPVFLNCFCSIFATLAAVEKLIIFSNKSAIAFLPFVGVLDRRKCCPFFQDLFLTIRSLPFCAGECCPFLTEKCDHSTATFCVQNRGKCCPFSSSNFWYPTQGKCCPFFTKTFSS